MSNDRNVLNENPLTKKAIEDLDLSIEKYAGFKNKNSFKTYFKNLVNKNDNYIFFGVIEGEEKVFSQDTFGDKIIHLVLKEKLFEEFKKIPYQKKILLKCFHIGKIEVLITSYIDFSVPIDVLLTDDRFTKLEQAMLGGIHGDLGLKKLKFLIHPQYAVHMEDIMKGILNLHIRVKDTSMLKSEFVLFKMTYRFSYAVSNKLYGVIHSGSPDFELDKVFSGVVKVIQRENVGSLDIQPSMEAKAIVGCPGKEDKISERVEDLEKNVKILKEKLIGYEATKEKA